MSKSSYEDNTNSYRSLKGKAKTGLKAMTEKSQERLTE